MDRFGNPVEDESVNSTVYFVKNLDAATGTMADVMPANVATITLPECSFTRYGY